MLQDLAAYLDGVNPRFMAQPAENEGQW